MSTIQEVKDLFNARMTTLSDQISLIENQVEQMFELVKAFGATSTELDNLKNDIATGFDTLTASVTKIGEDDPATP